MRRLYYLTEDLATTKAISETLQDEGISDWYFHVLCRDEAGLYQHHIHSANTLQQLDVIHTGERWAMIGAAVGLAAGLVAYSTEALPWGASWTMVVIMALVGGFFGAWQGGMVGMSRENYKIEPFHDDIENGSYLIMVDVNPESRPRVREIMNMGFPKVRFCGKDSTFVNPFKQARHVYQQTTH